MKIKQFFFLIFLIEILIQTIAPIYLNILDNKLELRTQSTTNYQFIWDDYNGALGDLQGDDILTYGASFGPFHNYEEITEKLYQANLSFSEIINIFSIGKTYFGREIYCARVTDEQYQNKKTEMLVVAQHHAREQITVENALYFLDTLINGYQNSDPRILKVLKHKEIYIIPSLNIDGAKIIHKFPWQRKTARPIDADGDGIGDEYNGTDHVIEPSDVNGDGYIDAYFRSETGYLWSYDSFEGVDLDQDGLIGEDSIGGVDPNRNYDLGFGNPYSSTSDPNGEAYRGPHPFSENSTARLRDFIYENDFRIAVSLHSGIQEIYCPVNVSENPKNDLDTDLYSEVASELTEITGFKHIYLDNRYNAGHWVNWMYWKGEENIVLAFNIEVYGDPDGMVEEEIEPGLVKDRGVWDFFNPPANEVISNCELICEALIFLTDLPYFDEKSSIVGFPFRFFFLIFVAMTYLALLNKRRLLNIRDD
ncbi:MAG: M14 family zinc carboxypeptidase [Candidatus Hodarchaeota archaeon]